MLSVNFVGCGALGKTIARLIHEHKAAEIRGVVNSELKHAQQAVAFIGAGKACSSIQDLPQSDITFITTKDDKIELICAELVNKKLLQPGSIVLHCSGSLSSDVLATAKNVNCYIASVHPIKSFADPKEVVSTFNGTYCAIEGDVEAKEKLKKLFACIGAVVMEIRKESKKKYHSASVMANNYLVTLHYSAVQNFMKSGIEEPVAIKLASSMMNDALKNLHKFSHHDALTGPIKRGDVQTVKGHVDAFADDEVMQNIYTSLGIGTLPITNHSSSIKNDLANVLNGTLVQEEKSAPVLRLVSRL